MDALRTLVPLAILFFVADLPWLYGVSGWVNKVVKSVQGGKPMEMRWQGAPVVYLALAFLVTKATSTLDAALIGLATYGVYDFTNYATLKRYPLEFAVADTVWGGVLFAVVRTVGAHLNLL
jgi:uncharacterized membrane protein